MDGPNTRRIVLLGKTGTGKSSLANTILGEAKFKINHFNDSEMCFSQGETKSVNGRSLTLIDSPGFFDPGRSVEDTQRDVLRCMTECAPGPHAFLIVLKMEKFTEREKAFITQVCEHFSEDALKYAVVVFTHGDQLPEGMTIKEYVGESEGLRDLVKRCGGRCHVFDTKYWKTNQPDDYRSNQFQVAQLLNSIDEIGMENNDGYCPNESLQAAGREIQKEGNAPQTWIKGLVGLTVIAGLLAAAVLISSKFAKALTETPLFGEDIIATTVATVKDKIPETVLSVPPLVSAIVEVAQEAVPPVNVMQNTEEDVFSSLDALCEAAFILWNPFE